MRTFSKNYNVKDFKIKPITSKYAKKKVTAKYSVLSVDADNIPDYISQNAQRMTLPDGGEVWHEIGYLQRRNLKGCHPGEDPVGPQGSDGSNIINK